MTLAPAHVAGAGMIRFGKYPVDVTLESMGVDAGRAALTDAGATLTTVDALYVGHVFGGPVAGQRIAAQLGLDGKPVSNHENYCASGATAVREAWVALAAGLHDVVLVIGVEKMTDRISGGVRPDPNDLDAAVGYVMAAGHAMSARRYMADHGATREQIAAVAVKNHAHSVHNPFAQYQKPISLDQVLSARPIAEPLGLLDCSPISDGAAAVVLCSPAGLRRLGIDTAVPKVLGAALVSGSVLTGTGDLNAEDVSRRAGEQAWELSGSVRTTWTSWRCTTASPSPRSSAWKGSDSSPSDRGRRGPPTATPLSADGYRSTRAAGCSRGATRSAPPVSRRCVS